VLFSLTPRETARLSQLKKVTLLSDLSLKQLEILDHMLHERTYLEGEFVFDEGDEGQALFIVLSGKIRTWRAKASVDQTVDFGPGAFFGELALLEDAPRSTSARAEEDSCLVALFRTDFLSLLETESLIASKISYALALDLAHKLRRMITSPQMSLP
jgi:CRP/FNR family cyclic AMP-dependent transcriptional regulator